MESSREVSLLLFSIVEPLESDSRWELIKQKANEARAVKAFALFRFHRIEPILIKGIAAAANYPEGAFRDSIDLDLAVPAADFSTAWTLIHSPEAKGLAIDLHSELRHLDVVPWGTLFSRSREIELDGGKVRFLSFEDHLRILCDHWLTDGGANRERLWDIFYAVENRPDDFDWEIVFAGVPPHRQRWVILALGIARREFGLNLSGTPVEDETANLPPWFVRTIKREWDDETRFRPLHDSMGSVSAFFRQLRKRIPPNPITATVLLGGDLDSPVLFHYQVTSSLKRIGPSIKNIFRSVRGRLRGN